MFIIKIENFTNIYYITQLSEIPLQLDPVLDRYFFFYTYTKILNNITLNITSAKILIFQHFYMKYLCILKHIPVIRAHIFLCVKYRWCKHIYKK